MENITLGQLQTTIIFLATFLTSGGVILAFALKIIRGIISKEITPLCEKMQNDIKLMHDELNENSLNTMKNSICNDNIPLSERVSIGQKYIEKGGNGAIKIRVHQLEEQYEKELKKGGKHNEQ